MFKRAMSSCANCSNPVKSSVLTKYQNISRARKLGWNHDKEEWKEKWNHESKQEWYVKADRMDLAIFSSLMIGSTILGGFIGGKEIYDNLEKDPSYYRVDEENYELRKNIGIGSLVGATGGFILGMVYPYPRIITTIGTGAFLYDCGPKILRAIKFYNNKK